MKDVISSSLNHSALAGSREKFGVIGLSKCVRLPTFEP